MEDAIEMLKLLNYETLFCKKKFRPFPRTYFAFPATNTSEQFQLFSSLVIWLFSLSDAKATGWDEFDDPGTICNHILDQCKTLNI